MKYKKCNDDKLADAISLLHIDGETEVKDDDDIQSLHITRPTRNTVPNLYNEAPDYDDSVELPDFIEQEYDEDNQLLLTNAIPPY